MITRFEPWARAVACGLAQIAFADRPAAGLLVLVGTGLVAPWSAAGALAGAVFGTIAGRLGRGFDAASWGAGVSGYNPAILGILWGGVLARGEPTAALFALALAGCCALEAPLHRMLGRIGLPPLALAAVLTGWASAWAFGAFGAGFWWHPGLLPLGAWGVAGCVLLVAVVLAWTRPLAMAQTAALTGSAALLSGLAAGSQLLGPAGLWAFTVAPAAFGIHAVLLAGSVTGALGGVAAAAAGAALWLAWTSSPLGGVVEPLVAPAVVGVWLALYLPLRRGGARILDPGLWRAARLLRGVRAEGGTTIALTGAGISTASGIPDYVSGAWLDPEVPASEYGLARFLSTPEARRAYWAACHAFRRLAACSRPNPAHLGLSALERRGWIAALVTQNVDRLHQAAGSVAAIELHGRMDETRCLACGARPPWPPEGAWEAGDVTCARCGALVKPAVVAMGEDLAPATWRCALAAAGGCRLVLVVGTQLAVASAASLVAEARRNGARIVFVNTGPVAQPVMPGDLFLSLRAEQALPALATLLDCNLPDLGRWPWLRQ